MTHLHRIYEPAAYQADALAGCWWAQTCPAPSAPQLAGDVHTDFAVIGAGFTGLSAALHLAQRGAGVTVLDLHQPGWGASGRNGGFCCLGGAKLGAAAMTRRYGAEDTAAYHATERRAVDFVAERIADLGIDVDRHSAGEVQLAHSPRAFARMQANPDPGARLLGPDDLRSEGLAAQGIHGGLHLPVGFALNPRKYVTGLARAVLDAGGQIFGDSPVTRIEPVDGGYVLHTAHGRVHARHLLLATNGYSADNLPPWMAGRYLPVQSSVIVTRPLSPAEIAAQGWHSDLMAYDSRHLLHYFRLLPDRRFLFGMRGGLRWTPAAQASIARQIRRDFADMFPAWRDVETPWFWSGLIALSRARVPYVGPIGDLPRAWAAFAWHGNGVAMGSLCGDRMARMALGDATDLPAFYALPPRRFEFGSWRRAQIWPAYAWYGLMDRL